VKTDGPKSQEGAPQTGTMSNVVPFPRDWLGPRDELVPFGRDAAEETEADAVAADIHEISVAPPPGPDAFWGEDSAEIHGVLQGPDIGARDQEQRDADHKPTPTTSRRPRRAVALIAAVLVAAVAALTVAVVELGGRSSSLPAREAIFNPSSGSLSAPHARLATWRKYPVALSAHTSRKVKPHGTATPARHRPVHASAPKPRHHATPLHTSSHAYPVSTQSPPSSTSTVSSAPSAPVSSSAPTQPVDAPSSSSGSVVSEPTQPTSSATTSCGSATSSHSGGQSSKAKAPAGPTGNSALLGPGHCNC
jgi:hypothetical protein